jgi:uncharacterized DUF497 family protein
VRFEWDPAKAASNARKHGVTFDEAAEVFAAGVVAFPRLDVEHDDVEERFQTLGPTSRRLVLVVWTERHDDVIRIISARPATRAERALYREFVEGSP